MSSDVDNDFIDGLSKQHSIDTKPLVAGSSQTVAQMQDEDNRVTRNLLKDGEFNINDVYEGSSSDSSKRSNSIVNRETVDWSSDDVYIPTESGGQIHLQRDNKTLTKVTEYDSNGSAFNLTKPTPGNSLDQPVFDSPNQSPKKPFAF